MVKVRFGGLTPQQMHKVMQSFNWVYRAGYFENSLCIGLKPLTVQVICGTGSGAIIKKGPFCKIKKKIIKLKKKKVYKTVLIPVVFKSVNGRQFKASQLKTDKKQNLTRKPLTFSKLKGHRKGHCGLIVLKGKDISYYDSKVTKTFQNYKYAKNASNSLRYHLKKLLPLEKVNWETKKLEGTFILRSGCSLVSLELMEQEINGEPFKHPGLSLNQSKAYRQRVMQRLGYRKVNPSLPYKTLFARKLQNIQRSKGNVKSEEA